MSDGAAQPDVGAVVAALAERGGVDLRGYLRGPVAYGVESRMKATVAATTTEYLRRLEEDSGELARLIEAVVVPVSGLFRDAEVFEALERVVVPTIAAEIFGGDLLRAWAAGVATGEEAWSLAVVLARACPTGPEFRVVGSDIAAAFLSLARSGRYPASSLQDRWERATEGLLSRNGDAVVASEYLRARVVFAEHDLVGRTLAPRPSVVASFHLITLRNVLIYLDRRARHAALARVVSALEPGGALVMGMVETAPRELVPTLGPFPGVDPRLRIYRKERRR